jgi:hypothetical protein
MAEPVVGREARTTRHRLVLRGLVVAGFASGVWLLSGSAAHAADGGHLTGGAPSHHTHGPVTRLLDGLGGMLGLETGSARSTAQPAASEPGAAPVTVPAPGLLGLVVAPAPAHQSAGRTDAASGASPAGPVVPAPARPVPGPVGVDHLPAALFPGVPAGLFDGVLGAPGASFDPLTDALAPLTRAVVRSTGPTVDAAARQTRSLLSRLAHRRALPRAVAGPRRLASLVGTPAGAVPAVATHPAGDLLGHARPAVSGRHPASEGAVRIGTEYRPILPRPAPLPASPGPGSAGLPTSAPASQFHGGSTAVLSTAAVSAPAALRRLSTAAQVEVRRLVVESPTVSPD